MSLLTLRRRELIAGLAAAPLILSRSVRAQIFADFPFSLGVASGDPAPDGFVIWTRLAPQPMEPHGGMPMAPVPVQWEVSSDSGFKAIVQKGEAIARPELAHSVHVEVEGLLPDRQYWYRFKLGGEISLWGRARTLPAARATVGKTRFAVVGCQHYEAGLYTGYHHLAVDAPDWVFHYGDYIYEYHYDFTLEGGLPVKPVRAYSGREPFSLDDYRVRYAQTKLDPDLQAAHVAAAWFTSYDDHEVQNNWVGDLDQNGTPPEPFLLRRTAAMQAFYEHMPVRKRSFPRNGTVDIVRRAQWGDLLTANFLDTRLYRTEQPCGDGFKPDCPARQDAKAEVIGRAQEKWLFDGLSGSKARWNVLAQQIMMMPMDRRLGDEPAPVFNLDSWNGYPKPRQRLFDRLEDMKLGNVVVLTGDEHQNYAGEIKGRSGKTIAAEFVGTSVSSSGDGQDRRSGYDRMMALNPNIKFNNAQRGYLICDVTPDRWQTQFRVMDQIGTPGAPIKTRATWGLERGRLELAEA